MALAAERAGVAHACAALAAAWRWRRPEAVPPPRPRALAACVLAAAAGAPAARRAAGGRGARGRRGLARRARGGQPAEATADSYGSAIAACAETGRWYEALDLLGQMPGAGLAVGVPTYNMVLRAFAEDNQLEWVLSLFGDMPRVGLVPDVATYAHVVAACERAGQWQLALQHLADMRGRGLQPDERVWSAVAGACAEADQWQWAVHAITDMQAQGLAPARDAFSAAIAACRRCGQAEWAGALSAQMQEAESARSPPARGLLRDLLPGAGGGARPARGARAPAAGPAPAGGASTTSAPARARREPAPSPAATRAGPEVGGAPTTSAPARARRKPAPSPAAIRAGVKAVPKTMEGLVKAVKMLCGSTRYADDEGARGWRSYCDVSGGSYNPERHSEDSLQCFLEGRYVVEDSGRDPQTSPWFYKIADLLRPGASALKAFRWTAYCTIFGERKKISRDRLLPLCDPAKYDEPFIKGFFEMLDTWPTDLAEQGAEVFDIEEYELLALRVLEMIEFGTPEQVFRWERYCHVVSGGKRDPMIHHDLQSLRKFFEQEEQALATDETAAEESGDLTSAKEPPEHKSVEDICWELAQYKEPSLLFLEACSEAIGAFSPWKQAKGRTVLDLHGLSVDVAKVAVWTTLNDLLLLPRSNPRLREDLDVIVGKGLHSDGGDRKVGPEVQGFLTESFMFRLPPLQRDLGTIKLPGREISRVHQSHPYFVSEREKAAVEA